MSAQIASSTFTGHTNVNSTGMPGNGAWSQGVTTLWQAAITLFTKDVRKRYYLLSFLTLVHLVL